jgi:ABC-type Fe3+-siderophore transport system permease subunit
MLLLLSFNYTPPPPEGVKDGNIAIAILFALLILVPNVKLGAFIGGLGVAIIVGLVQSHAGGDLGGLSVITHPPVYAAVGALCGAFISFISRSAWQALHKQSSSNATPNEPE